MIFNNIDFGDYIKVERVRDPLLPSIKNITKELSGKHGLLYRKNTLEAKYIEVEIRLIEKNRSKVKEKARTLARLLYTDEPKELRFKEEPDKYYIAILDGNTDLDRFLFTGFAVLTFLATDPIAYGETRKLDLTTDTTFYNLATAETRATITIPITSNIDHIRIVNQNTGEFIQVEHNFIVGDKIIIDFQNELVTKNGYSIMKDLYLESDFFTIQVGENRITSNVIGTLEYIERWL